EIVKRALARDPESRYQSARTLGRDLTRFLFRFGLPVSDDDVAELVIGALGGGGPAPVDGVKKIAEMIDLMLLEFRSLTKEEPQNAAPSLFPGALDFPSNSDSPESDSPLGGLADELEGPEPVAEESSTVASWFRGFIR